MASLSPSTIPVSTTSLKNNKPFVPKPSQLSLLRNPTRLARKVSCNATKNDNNEPQNPKTSKVDRRNMLLGLGGLYGAAANLGVSPSSLAKPAVLDLNAPCERTPPTKDTPGGLNCCPPRIDPRNVVDFDLKNYPSPALRVRPAAHKVDAEYLAKYQKAIRLMKALPANDPRNFFQQANVHCAYCNDGYHMLYNNKDKLQVHDSWLFLPFHRAYLFFFERILGKLIGDPTFAMPFWNWDHPDGMRMPTMYADGGPSNPLYNPNRDPQHQPPRMIDLAYNADKIDVVRPEATQTYYNLWHMYINVVRPKTAELFMGGRYTVDQNKEKRPGSVERTIHNAVHDWTGDRNKKFHLDMGALFSAARDPAFYGHHSNIDRLWSIWKGLDCGRPDFNDCDWLNTYFVFYDENRNPIKIYVKDVLDEKKLGYTYQDSELPWLSPAKPMVDGKALAVPERKPAQTVTLPRPLGTLGFRTKISRAALSRREKAKNNKAEEVLVIGFNLEKTDKFVKFDVYLNDQHDHSSSGDAMPTITYVGSYAALPHTHTTNSSGEEHNHGKKTELKLPITEVIRDVGADNDESVDVVFVTRSGDGSTITITDINVDYVNN